MTVEGPVTTVVVEFTVTVFAAAVVVDVTVLGPVTTVVVLV